MYSMQETLKLKYIPTDIWSIREQLCLASSVLKSGDQNWISVSRSLKAIGDIDSNRSFDWFSQKSCAQQYACLLENVDIPKRKKRESGETTSESIVRRLTQDRIFELSNLLSTQREEYQLLKNEIYLLRNGTISLEKLQKMYRAIEEEQKEVPRTHIPKVNILANQNTHDQPPILLQSPIESDENEAIDTMTPIKEASQNIYNNDNRKNNFEKTSLLTNLLNSSNPTAQLQTFTQSTNAPTIASLLCSSPKVPGSSNQQNMSSQLNQPVCSTVLNNTQEKSSITAPTLSKLLEQPSASAQQNLIEEVNPKKLHNSMQVQNKPTRSVKLEQVKNTQEIQKSQILNENSETTETDKATHNSIDEIIQEAVPIDKDEINEIIGDIEEFIKEEITSSPESFNSAVSQIPPIVRSNKLLTTDIIERSEPRNVDESASLSNSPSSEIAIEDIDSSSSNIAKIIGTAVETIEYKLETFNSFSNKKQESTFTDETEIDTIKEINFNFEASQNTTNVSQNYIRNESSNMQLIRTENKTMLKSVDEKTLERSRTYYCATTDENEIEFEKPSTNYLPESQGQNYDCDSDSIGDKEFRNQIVDALKGSVSIQQSDELEDIVINKKLVSESEGKKLVEECTFESEIHCHQMITGVNKAPCSNDVVKKVDEISDLKIGDTLEDDQTQRSSMNIKDTFTNLVKREEKTFSSCDPKNLKSHSDNDMLINKYSFSIQSENLKIKRETMQESLSVNKFKENNSTKKYKLASYIKIEEMESSNENTDSDEFKKDRGSYNSNIDRKPEILEPSGISNDIDEEEPAIGKLQGGRAIKTYSKKQNCNIDSEAENESNGENADYRAWKKSIMLVYHRLSTNKYASIFLRPITEDQAPGYHSVIFKPMDLSTIKKNIDNGTIRSTSHFQRDVMLMFQNAIMFNKYSTFVHKMTLEMQEECLPHIQILVHAAGKASFKRETRTATSNETSEMNSKRKWTHMSFSLYDVENHKNKKRKSENE